MEALAILCIPILDCCAQQALGVDFSTELLFGRCHAVQSSMDAVQHDSNGHDLQRDCNGHLRANVAEQPLNGVRGSEEVRAQELRRAKKGKVCDINWTAWTCPSRAPDFGLAANAVVNMRGWAVSLRLSSQYLCGCAAQMLRS